MYKVVTWNLLDNNLAIKSYFTKSDEEILNDQYRKKRTIDILNTEYIADIYCF